MISTPSRFEALKLVIDAYGTQEAAAEALGVYQSTVSRWVSQSKRLPAEYVLKAEADTGISRHHLRPDIYPPPQRFLAVDQGAPSVSFQSSQISHRGVDEVGAAA
jgi:DNA-binding transcriptional regulator YdaS (Cro superfamily)